jgi:O-antigen ligase
VAACCARRRAGAGFRVSADPARRAAAAILPATVVIVLLAYAPALAAPFVEIKLAALVVGGALAAATWLRARVDGDGAARLDPAIARAGAAVLLTTALSAAVAGVRGRGAPYAGVELARWGAAAGVALGTAMTVASGKRERLVDAIQIAAALVAAIGLAQHLGVCPLPIPSISAPGSTFGNRNIAAEAMAAALPFGLAGVFTDARPPGGATGAVRGRLAGLFAIVQLAFLVVARTRGAWIGGAAGVAAFLAVRRPRLSWRLVAGGVVAGAVIGAAAALPARWTAQEARDAKRFAPAAAVAREGLSVTSPVARTRFGLWRRAWAMYREAPLFGIGPGNFAVVFPRHAEPDATHDRVLSPTRAPQRAHDDLLERLTETGPLGLLAWLALYAAAAAAAGRARGADPGEMDFAAGCAGSLAAVAGCGLTGFPMAMPATALLFAVGLGGLAARPDGGAAVPLPRRAPVLRGGATVLGAALVVAAIVWPARRLAASLFLGRAERALGAGDAPGDAARALPDLARAARALPDDFQVALRTAYAASRAGRPGDAMAAAQRALSVEPDSPNAWEALARARLEAGDPAGAAAAADRALALLHAYAGALYTRAAAARALGDDAGAGRARAALAALAATDPQARWLLDRLDGR